MRTALILAALLIGASSFGQQPGTVRFETVAVYIDSAGPLAAWQFELSERNGSMTVVGVENGDSAAFGDAPYYDLGAVSRGSADRIIVADFSLADEPDLPTGSTRVATVHVQLSGRADPDYQLRLIAAGDADGRPMQATISLAAAIGR